MSSYYEDEEERDEEEQEVMKDFQTMEDNLMVLIDARPAMLAKNADGKVRAMRRDCRANEVDWKRHQLNTACRLGNVALLITRRVREKGGPGSWDLFILLVFMPLDFAYVYPTPSHFLPLFLPLSSPR